MQILWFGNLPLWRQALRGIGAILCNLIYRLIRATYQLFTVVARLNILSDDKVAPIYQRITMILTIVMTFYITFEFVKYVIQPDTFSDKEKGVGNLAFRMIAVVILIAFVPRVFTMAYKLQTMIIEKQIITKVIIGNVETNYETLGGSFSANMLELFYEVDEDVCGKGGKDCTEETNAVNKNLNNLEAGNTFNLNDGINSSKSEDEPKIKFDGFLAVIVGGFILYILVMYSIDVGTRYVQLIFLQVMAPIAIMGYLSPKKDNTFQKWWKQCITTYLDLFIRLAIIHFVLLIVKVLGDAYPDNLFTGIPGLTSGIKLFAYIVLIMGLLAFAQKAPKMLSELLPSSGSAAIGFGLGAKSRIEPTTKAVKGLGNVVGNVAGTGRRVAGAAGGFIAGGVAGRGLKGALEGAKAGFDSKQKGLFKGSVITRIKNAGNTGGAIREQREDIRAAGGTVWGAEHRQGHYKNVAQEQDRRVRQFENVKNYKENAQSTADEVKEVKKAKAHWESLKAGGASEAEIEAARKEYKARQKAVLAGKVQVDAATGQRYMEYEGRRVNIDSEDEVRVSGVKQQIQKMRNDMKAEQTDGLEVTFTDKSTGKEVTKKISEMTDQEFIENMGSISTTTEEHVKEMKRNKDYIQAHANAKGSGGSSS